MAFESLGKIFSLKNMKNSFKKEIPSCPKKSWNNSVIVARLVETNANENDLNLNKLIENCQSIMLAKQYLSFSSVLLIGKYSSII